jgi:hypothetical protein
LIVAFKNQSRKADKVIMKPTVLMKNEQAREHIYAALRLAYLYRPTCTGVQHRIPRMKCTYMLATSQEFFESPKSEHIITRAPIVPTFQNKY